MTPAAAEAARIDVQGNHLRYYAAAGEVNSFTVAVRAGDVTFTDPGKPFDTSSAQGRCGSPVDGAITCSLTGLMKVKVDLADGDDRGESVDGPAEIDGGEGADTLIGGPGDDDLDGGAGDDLLQGRGGRDSFVGGDGIDKIDYLDHTASVVANFDGVANDGSAGENELVPSDAEYLVGGQGADTLTAAPTGSYLQGSPGDDMVVGGPGDDTLFGGSDGDELHGGGGIDRISGDLGPDRIFALDGNAETVECGGELDRAQADALDSLFDCEVRDDGTEGSPGGSEPVAPPQLGRSVSVAPESGTVTVREPGGRATTLAAGDNIPLGSIVDTTRGTVALTSAANARGKTQTAEFRDGVFKVTQTRGRAPVTELVLKGALECPRAAPARVKPAASRRARTRRLWGSGKGRFRTRGRRSSATVRGTTWLVEDRCGGTLTRVKQGVVEVRDFRTKRTKLVRAGRSYLAR